MGKFLFFVSCAKAFIFVLLKHQQSPSVSSLPPFYVILLFMYFNLVLSNQITIYEHETKAFKQQERFLIILVFEDTT